MTAKSTGTSERETFVITPDLSCASIKRERTTVLLDLGQWQLAPDARTASAASASQGTSVPSPSLSPSAPPAGSESRSAREQLDFFGKRWEECSRLLSSGQRIGAVVTTPAQIKMVSKSVSHLYIPGEFCRQGDVLQAAAESGKHVLLERGAFLAPQDIVRALEKLEGAQVSLVDAGTSFGYSDRVLDPRALSILKSTGKPFGVQVSDLSSPQTSPYTWRPGWLSDERFLDAFVCAGLAFDASFFVIKVPAADFLETSCLRLESAMNAQR